MEVVVSFRRAGEVRLRIVDFKAGKEGLMGGKKTWRKVGLAVATAGQSVPFEKRGIQTTWNRLNGDGRDGKSGKKSAAGSLTGDAGGAADGSAERGVLGDVETADERARRRRREGGGVLVGEGTFGNSASLGE